MKRLLCGVAALSALAAVPVSANAAIMELGATTTAVTAPPPCTTTGTTTHCPNNVTPANYDIILTRSTAIETLRDGRGYPTKVTKPGRIVAFTLGLSQLDTNRTQARSEIHFLDQTYGGTTQAAISVLAPVGRKSQRRWKVVAVSEIKHIQPYLGQVVQFWLNTTLPVIRGDVVALSIPTWAPVLSIGVASKKFAYRQSRSSNCSQPAASNQAQLQVNQVARYGCDYPGTRVEYSATEVTDPVAINPIHAPDMRWPATGSTTTVLGAQ